LTVSDNGGLDNKATTSVTVRKIGGKTGGSGGGSLGWLMLAMLIGTAVAAKAAPTSAN